MDDLDRPSPDEILERIKAAEASQERARFKIFFGMCAGVGKTYAMLQEARSAKAAGAKVVLGLVETHGRRETEALLAGLEPIPLRSVDYRGVTLRELDVDAIVDSKPDVVVIDELAHTNAPGSLRVKRWQDVFAILDHGISVWTAVNVQHIESLADVVEDFTAVPIRERVPDTVLDRADEIRLIDIAPGDLIRRLESGQVYTGDVSRVAIDRFFKPRNLGALRELALRFSSGRAERDLSAYARADGGLAPGSMPGGTILVAVGPSPSSAFLVRWARRTAYALKAQWIAIHVDTGGKLDRKDAERLEANLALARKLGGETIFVQSGDVPAKIVETAKARSASMIVIGRSGLSPVGFLPRRPTVSDRIVRDAGPIDVAVVQDSKAPRAGLRISRVHRFLEAPPRQYAFLGALCAAVTLLGFLLSGRFAYWGISLVYLIAMLGASYFVSPGPIVVFALSAALVFNFFFIPPIYTLSIGSPEDALLFAVFLVAALIMGSFVTRLRSSERLLRGREGRASFLLEAAERLAECRSSGEAAVAAATLVAERFATDAALFLADENGALSAEAVGNASSCLDDKERIAASLCFTERAICGAGTDSLPESRLHYLPAATARGAIGVLALRLPPDSAWKRSDDTLLLSLGRTLSLVVERETAERRSHHAALEVESERLSTLLLDLVSHELRTPLTTITGSITALGNDAIAVDPASRKEILGGALEAADRLDRIVEEILSMNKIESGALRLDRSLVDLSEIESAALREMGKALNGRRVDAAAIGGQHPVLVDASLVTHLVANLLRNAAAYSKPEGSIELRFEEEGGCLAIAVRDRGPGIPPGETALMFERFKRGRSAPTGGIGLGLTICKGIAEAHGGSIDARQLQSGDFEVRAIFPGCVRQGRPLDGDGPSR